MGRFCNCLARVATCFCYAPKHGTDQPVIEDPRSPEQILNNTTVCFASSIDSNAQSLPNSTTPLNNNFNENNIPIQTLFVHSQKEPPKETLKVEYTSGVNKHVIQARKETTIIHWKIKDFPALCELKELLRNETCIFTAGQSLNKPTRWAFNIQRMKQENNLGLFLKRLEPVTFRDVLELESSPKAIKSNAVANRSIRDGRGDNGQALTSSGGTGRDKDEAVYIHYECIIKRSGYGDVWIHKRTCIPNFTVNSRLGFRKLFTMDDFKAADESNKQKVPPLLGEDNTLYLEIKFTIHLRSIERTKSETDLRKSFSLEAAERYHARLLREELRNLFVTGISADIVLVIESELPEERTFLAHKGILAARSPVFEGLIQSGMRESASGIVRIKDVSVKAMENVLSYIYTGLTDEKLNWSDVREVQELIYAADKYCLVGLRSYCDKMLFTGCENSNAMDLLYLAQMHSLKVAMKEISIYIQMNANEIFGAAA